MFGNAILSLVYVVQFIINMIDFMLPIHQLYLLIVNVEDNIRVMIVSKHKCEISISDRRTLTPDEAIRELQGTPEKERMFDFWITDFRFFYEVS
jgi:hypothetical protein